MARIRPTKEPKWVEFDRHLDTLTFVLSEATSGLTYTYACAVYIVREKRTLPNGTMEFRELTKRGEPLYRNDHPELWLAFDVAGMSVAELRSACAREDRGRKTKRK